MSIGTHSNNTNQNWFTQSHFLLAIILTIITSLAIIACDVQQYTDLQQDLFITLNLSMQVFTDAVWFNLTYLGDGLILIPLLSILCLTKPRAWAALFGTIPAALILCRLGKNFFAVPRPAAVIDNEQFNIVGETLTAYTSFPSGHTITIFSAAFVLLFVYRGIQCKQSTKLLGMTFVLIFAAMIGLSRVAVGAHWPLDVVMGAFIGFFCGASGAYLTQRYQAWWQWTETSPRKLAVFLLIFPTVIFARLYEQSLPSITLVWLAAIVAVFVSIILVVKANKPS